MFFRLAVLIISLTLLKTAIASDLDDLQLQSLISKNPTTNKPTDSIEELLPLLPKEFLENFTFVYDSRSPFKSSISPEYPRVILFSKDAKMILTFTGNPLLPGYQILETLSFNSATSRFSTNVYELPMATRLKHNLSAEQKNCSACHGKDIRPIFDSYPLWPGFYGSIRDTFPQSNSVGKKEFALYKKFLNTSAKEGLYRFLKFKNSSSVSPYLDPKKFKDETLISDEIYFKFLPNTRLGMALTELNRKRIYRKLTESAEFNKNEKRILSVLLSCKKSPAIKKQISLIQKNIFFENKDRLNRLGLNPKESSKNLNMIEQDFSRELAEIDWMAQILSINRGDWSMALEPDSNSYFDGILSGISSKKSYYIKEDFIFEILKNLSDKQPEYKKFFRPKSYYDYLGYPFGNKIDLQVARSICTHL